MLDLVLLAEAPATAEEEAILEDLPEVIPEVLRDTPHDLTVAYDYRSEAGM